MPIPSLDRVDHVHVYVADRAASEAWYAQVLGLTRVAELAFWASDGGPLTLGAIPGEERPRLACAACGHINYVNPRLVTTAIPITDRGEVVLLRRGLEPGRGLWAQPGGFLEVDETVTEAAIRETFEETGLVVVPGEIIGLYSRLEAAVVVVAFEALVTGGSFRPNTEALEIVAFRPEEIPWPGVAFATSRWAIHDWIRRRHPDLPLPDMR